MKKIVLILILVGLCACLVGCEINTKVITALDTPRHAIIIMPTGEIVQGECTDYLRYGDNWLYAKIDGIDYYTATWRIVMYEK